MLLRLFAVMLAAFAVACVFLLAAFAAAQETPGQKQVFQLPFGSEVIADIVTGQFSAFTILGLIATLIVLFIPVFAIFLVMNVGMPYLGAVVSGKYMQWDWDRRGVPHHLRHVFDEEYYAKKRMMGEVETLDREHNERQANNAASYGEFTNEELFRARANSKFQEELRSEQARMEEAARANQAAASTVDRHGDVDRASRDRNYRPMGSPDWVGPAASDLYQLEQEINSSFADAAALSASYGYAVPNPADPHRMSDSELEAHYNATASGDSSVVHSLPPRGESPPPDFPAGGGVSPSRARSKTGLH